MWHLDFKHMATWGHLKKMLQEEHIKSSSDMTKSQFFRILWLYEQFRASSLNFDQCYLYDQSSYPYTYITSYHIHGYVHMCMHVSWHPLFWRHSCWNILNLTQVSCIPITMKITTMNFIANLRLLNWKWEPITVFLLVLKAQVYSAYKKQGSKSQLRSRYNSAVVSISFGNTKSIEWYRLKVS